MTSNETPNKPEWFELINGDAPSAQVTKVNKVLPSIAVLVSGALIATGAFFASASGNQTDTAPVSQATTTPVATPSTTPVATPSATKSKVTPTPPVMLPPTGGRDDEGDDHGGRRGHDD